MLTPELRQDYLSKWNNIHISPRLVNDAVWAFQYIVKHWERYRAVAAQFKVPADVIAVIHMREASGDFDSHLANGDPLTARTIHEPPGLPEEGEPPFTWEQGAIAALRHEGWDELDLSSDIAAQLYHLEMYNGPGYLNRGMPSPYLWAGSNWEVPGLYQEDHVFHPDKLDDQPGAAVILKILRRPGNETA